MCTSPLKQRGKSRALVIALAAMAAFPSIGLLEKATAAGPRTSPFAGDYCPSYASIEISGSGRITGTTWFGGEISGRISDTGAIDLKWPLQPSLDIGRHRRGPAFIKAIGMAALDERGNLYGVLRWEDGSVSEFFWPRCE
jgi:hypothetical protein